MKSLDDIKSMDSIRIEKLAQAIETDAGQALPDLRTALAEAKAGQFSSVHTPAAIEARKRGRPVGSVKLPGRSAWVALIRPRLDSQIGRLRSA